YGLGYLGVGSHPRKQFVANGTGRLPCGEIRTAQRSVEQVGIEIERIKLAAARYRTLHDLLEGLEIQRLGEAHSCLLEQEILAHSIADQGKYQADLHFNIEAIYLGFVQRVLDPQFAKAILGL